MNWSDAQDWLDFIDHVWIGFVLIAVAGIPAWFSAKNGKGIKKITDQVVNGHKDPLRSDLDQVISKLTETESKVDHLVSAVAGLRDELADEESLRRSSVREVREDLDRRFSDLLQRFFK